MKEIPDPSAGSLEVREISKQLAGRQPEAGKQASPRAMQAIALPARASPSSCLAPPARITGGGPPSASGRWDELLLMLLVTAARY